ncbi:MAG: DUF3071 domain-containing protein [Nocardioides sp.]|nr:DUF3071 domain-containing protein [Nocardioides sp.]
MSEDGRKLVLVSDAGVEFTVDVDDRLRAALSSKRGGDQARLGQLETQMQSTLRPRDIQARIRAGETPESVAQVAGTSVDKVMPYAAPVLAEREHVAQRAQRASIRRPLTEGAAPSARTLGEAIGSHLRSRNVDPDTVSWDAWRREDGRWTLTGAYTTTGRVGAAHFSFDPPGNYVVADDEDAHWLLGELPDEPAAPARTPRDDLSDARRRRLSAVPPDELPLGDDAIELVSEDAGATASLGAEAPVEAYLEPGVGEGAGAIEASDEADASDDDRRRPEPPARKPVKKTRGRASVPSWDEIMFGGGGGED